ncbi:4'-phosphopantetheinyl transferase superfamily protein [Streptomyces sp. WMMC500]|uniref:4'-phosphopantetheinyl transferase family protein n=1 Tax=Streptomyces sp. WMMC500 TaxID=3015154 RepID=UPI00248B49B7|nr:4'-phosphopantetheinyl transferase superfamily protein [Streptomyces sp. WMMC500]WBB61551.1 4'-phosphopantetheinyl transferase superfamily protein [Streptomyces sp. WMMC500]
MTEHAAGGVQTGVRAGPGAAAPSALPAGTRVWTFAAGEGVEPDLSALDEGERRRQAAFLHRADRIRYGVAHAALRRLLGELTGTAPAALRFGRRACPRCGGPHGRPVLERPAGGPEFSLSHGGELVLVAVAPGRVGVDVEPVRAVPPEPGLVERLHPAERAVVGAAPASLRSAAFTRVWTRKEAYLKGLGVGLGRALDADDVSTGVPGWHLVDLAPGHGHAGALAVESAVIPDPDREVREARRARETPETPETPATPGTREIRWSAGDFP